MGTDSIIHSCSSPIRHLKRQKKVIAQDYPFFAISAWKCSCGCNSYAVTLHKIDLGYTKKIFDIEYTSSLEAFIKLEKLTKECEDGRHDMQPLKEGEAFE